MTYGTLSVDFAGTRNEARDLVNAHPELSLSHKPGAEESIPVITAIYTSDDKRQKLLALLKSLGWDQEFVGDSTLFLQTLRE